MEKENKKKKENWISAGFTNEDLVSVIDSLQKSNEEFGKVYDTMCYDLKNLIYIINRESHNLIPSEIKRLNFYIDGYLGSIYNEFRNFDLNCLDELYLNLTQVNELLQNKLRTNSNDVVNNDKDKTAYLDLANYIYDNLSSKVSFEEKKVIENKLKELYDAIDSEVDSYLEENPFNKIEYQETTKLPKKIEHEINEMFSKRELKKQESI